MKKRWENQNLCGIGRRDTAERDDHETDQSIIVKGE